MRCRIFAAIAAVLSVPVATVTLSGCGGVRGNTPDLAPHLIAQPDVAPVRPIDGKDGVMLSEYSGALTPAQFRDRVNELYAVVVFDGQRPIFPWYSDK